MRKYWAAGLFLWAVLGTLAFCIVSKSGSRPVYAGKNVGQWLDAGYEDAALALQEIGPPAVPYIFAKLSREDPQFGSARFYREIWTKCPAFARASLPKPKATNFDAWRACSALLEIGPTAIPSVAVGLQSRNPGVRKASAHALELFRQRGADLGKIRSLLLKRLKDSDPEVRKHIRAALGDKPLLGTLFQRRGQLARARGCGDESFPPLDSQKVKGLRQKVMKG